MRIQCRTSKSDLKVPTLQANFLTKMQAVAIADYEQSLFSLGDGRTKN